MLWMHKEKVELDHSKAHEYLWSMKKVLSSLCMGTYKNLLSVGGGKARSNRHETTSWGATNRRLGHQVNLASMTNEWEYGTALRNKKAITNSVPPTSSPGTENERCITETAISLPKIVCWPRHFRRSSWKELSEAFRVVPSKETIHSYPSLRTAR